MYASTHVALPHSRRERITVSSRHRRTSTPSTTKSFAQDRRYGRWYPTYAIPCPSPFHPYHTNPSPPGETTIRPYLWLLATRILQPRPSPLSEELQRLRESLDRLETGIYRLGVSVAQLEDVLIRQGRMDPGMRVGVGAVCSAGLGKHGWGLSSVEAGEGVVWMLATCKAHPTVF
jgi:hypothetical protein